MKRCLCFLSFLFFFESLSARFPNQEKENNLIQKLCDHIEMMRHEMSNHDAEIRTLQSKLINIEDGIELLRKNFEDTLTSVKEKNKEKDFLESKISSQHLSTKTLVADIKSLQSYIEECQKKYQMQSKEIDHIKQALKSLMTAMSIKDVEPNMEESSSPHTYKVKSGDSLGIIAQKHGVKIKEIKEINHLKNDVIFQGQILKIPK